MKQTILVLLSFILFASAGNISFSQPDGFDTPTKIKAQFIYNFTKNIEWPEEYKKGNFLLGIVGNAKLYADLKQFFSSRMLGYQKYEVKFFQNAAEISKCQLLFIPSDYNGNFKEIIAKLKSKSTLIVSDKVGMTKQGAVINLIYADNKQKFELSLANATKCSLKVSSSLINLGIKVD